jgi:hypothetical protein
VSSADDTALSATAKAFEGGDADDDPLLKRSMPLPPERRSFASLRTTASLRINRPAQNDEERRSVASLATSAD